MNEKEGKRGITQQELDAVYAQYYSRRQLGSPENHPMEKALSDSSGIFAKLGEAFRPHTDHLGIHLRHDRTTVLLLSSKKPSFETRSFINAGYEDLETLYTQLSRWLLQNRISRLPVILTLTGKTSSFFIAKLPKLPRAQMLKAIHLEMKQRGREEDEIHNILLPAQEKKEVEGPAEYLVAGIHKGTRDSVLTVLYKLKLKLRAWDLDILCYARTANFLWQTYHCEDSTRFLIFLEWDHCHLIILSASGQLVVPTLPIGIQSFMENMISKQEPDWRTLASDPFEVRQRKLMANQAIHDVFVPFAQQVKTKLYASCNERGIPLPTHFAIAGEGGNLLRITDSLASDFGLKIIPMAQFFPAELTGAVGAVLWENQEVRMNFLPPGRLEILRTITQSIRQTRKKFSPSQLWENVSDGLGFGNTTRGVFAILGIFAILISFPVGKRILVSRELSATGTVWQSLSKERARIAHAEEREQSLDKRMMMKKLIEQRRIWLGRAVKELISILPTDVKLQSLTFKGDTLILKGSARSQADVQKYLKSAQTLHHLADPTPIGIKREKGGTLFELSFKLQTDS